MWVLPRNHQLSYLCAQDMVDSNLVSKEQLGRSISCLMWRSKPSLLRTWLIRWRKGGWVQYLFGRILKPSQQKSFEDALTSSLEDIRVNRSVLREKDSDQKIQGTCGLTSKDILKHYSTRQWFFSKMLKDISAKGSPKSSPIWKKWRTELSAEYSARLKLAHLTREKECLSWRTPAVLDPGITLDRSKCSVRIDSTGENSELGNSEHHGPPTSKNRRGIGEEQTERRLQELEGGCCEGLAESPTHDGWCISGRGEAFRLNKCGGGKWPARPGQKQFDWEEPRVVADQHGNGCDEGRECVTETRRDGSIREDRGKTKPELGRAVDGITDRVDRLRLLGNGVVPETAAKAFIVLFNKLFNEEG